MITFTFGESYLRSHVLFSIKVLSENGIPLHLNGFMFFCSTCCLFSFLFHYCGLSGTSGALTFPSSICSSFVSHSCELESCNAGSLSSCSVLNCRIGEIQECRFNTLKSRHNRFKYNVFQTLIWCNLSVEHHGLEKCFLTVSITIGHFDIPVYFRNLSSYFKDVTGALHCELVSLW